MAVAALNAPKETFKGMEEPEVGDCQLKSLGGGTKGGAKRKLDALVTVKLGPLNDALEE